MSAERLLELVRAEREALLARATALLKADERIAGAWLDGSLGRGEGDALSDIDLWVAVADAHCGEIVTARRDYAARLGRPLLIAEAPRNAPAGGAYLLVLCGTEAGPQQVDWYWQPASGARIPADVRMLFERTPLPREVPAPASRLARAEAVDERVAHFWAMSHAAARHIARGDPCAALRMLEMVDGSLAEVQLLAGGAALGSAGIGRTPLSLQPARQLALLRELAWEMEALTSRIVALGGTVPVQAILQIHRYFDLAEAMVGDPVEAVRESAL